MDETPRLFDVEPHPAKKTPEGVAYICPQCWQRVYLLFAPEEPPRCDPCSEQMILLPRGHRKSAAPPAPETAPETPADSEEKPGLL